MHEDVPPNMKVKGVLAQLNTHTCDGKRVDSKLVFKPICDYYVPKWNDDWASTEFTDFEDAIKKFGRVAVERATNGEIVKVKHNLGVFAVKKTCPYGEEFIKVKDRLVYPYEAFAERLVQKALYEKMHPSEGRGWIPKRRQKSEKNV